MSDTANFYREHPYIVSPGEGIENAINYLHSQHNQALNDLKAGIQAITVRILMDFHRSRKKISVETIHTYIQNEVEKYLHEFASKNSKYVKYEEISKYKNMVTKASIQYFINDIIKREQNIDYPTR